MDSRVVIDELIEVANHFYKEVGALPNTLYVSRALYEDIWYEGYTSIHGESKGFEIITLQTAYGRFDIAIDKDMPEEIEYYFDGYKMWWLDKLAEDILLKGE